jgi:hypothetical protein
MELFDIPTHFFKQRTQRVIDTFDYEQFDGENRTISYGTTRISDLFLILDTPKVPSKTEFKIYYLGFFMGTEIGLKDHLNHSLTDISERMFLEDMMACLKLTTGLGKKASTFLLTQGMHLGVNSEFILDVIAAFTRFQHIFLEQQTPGR